MRRLLHIAIALTGLLCPAVCLVGIDAAAAEPKRVLLLNSYGRDYAPWYSGNFRSELDRQWSKPVDVYEAPLTITRFADGQEEDLFADYLETLFSKHPFDLVVSFGAPAATFFQKYRQRLLPSTPMLFTIVEQRRVPFTKLTANDTVVAMSIDLAGVVDNILRVRPDTNNIAVVIGNSAVEKYWLEQTRIAVQPFADNVAFTWFNDLPFDEILKRAAALPPRSAIFFVLMSVDAAGASHEDGKALPRLRAVANAPIFTYTDAYFGQGIVGGPLFTVKDITQQAATVAVRILGGESPADIKTPPVGFGTPKFDWRELQRWNVNESRLPPGSEVHFRPPGMWEQYRLQLAGGLAALLLQAAMIAWLLLERRRRHFSELESRGRLRQVTHLDRVAAVGAMSASIAHELNQPLGAILANAEAAELLLAANPVDHVQLKEIVTDIRHSDQRAVDIIAHMRGLLKKRGDAELQEADLNNSIRHALHMLEPEARKRGVLVSTYQMEGALLVRAEQVHLEQVIWNLATNAMDAMQACAIGTRKMTVQTALVGDSEVEISVSDSGPGIPNDEVSGVFEAFYTTKQQGTGLGLSIVRTIVENCGGKAWAENRPGGGAVFRFTLPLSRAHSA